METITKVAWAHIRDGKLLCVRTRGIQFFYNVGGKPEAGESDIDALVREVREEVGAELLRPSIRHACEFRNPGVDKAAGKEVVLKLYFADFAGELRPANEIEEMRYLGLADKELLPPSARQAMEFFKEIGLMY